MKTTIQTPYIGHSKTRSQREAYRNTILTQEIRKISNKEPIFTPKTTRERKKKTQNPKLVGRNLKDQSINKSNRDKNNNSKDQKSKS